MYQMITAMCVILLASRCIAGPLEGDGPGTEGQVMNHRLRDRPNGGSGVEMGEVGGGEAGGPGGTVVGQKTGEAPVYGLMKYFSYLTRSSTHNTQMLQVLKSIMAETTETRVKVDQINEKLDLILTRVTVVQVPQVQPQETKRASPFSSFKLFT